MSSNAQVAGLLEEIAQLLELTGADSFRASANARAARTIADWPADVVALSSDRAALTSIPGVGPKIADKIVEFARTGRIQERDELLAQAPAGLLEVLKVPGLGPKTVRAMWQTLGVTDVQSLRASIDDGSIMNVPRMGAKTVENIRKSLAFAEKSGERVPLGVAAAIADVFIERLRAVKGVESVEAAGSLRRGRDTIGDIDLLASTSDPRAAAKAFCAMPEVTDVLASGESKCSVRVRAHVGDAGHVDLQIDLRMTPAEVFGATLLYFTGSKEHNVRLRERALRMGCTLNEWGLFPEDDDKKPPQSRGVKPVAARTEEDIYAKLGEKWIPPELREGHSELDAFDESAKHAPPRLVEVADIRAELHAHTTASDGAMSIVELAEAAKARGFHTIGVTDHSRSQPVANGLSPERLLEHIEAVHAARSKVKGITILAGSEVDIRADGSLDYDDDLLAKLDLVVASPHVSLKQTPEAATKRLLRAIEHPLVHIIGHPTGRLVNRREGLAPDIEKLVAAAVEHDVALEVNAHWMRLDLRDTHVRAATLAGALVAIDCDVHSPADFDNLRFGVTTARRGWLEKDKCINTWSAAKLHEWLARKRPVRAASGKGSKAKIRP